MLRPQRADLSTDRCGASVRISTLFSGLCIAVAAIPIALGLICLANPHRPLFYLIDIFSVPILSGAVLLAGLFLMIRQPRAAMVSGFGAALLLAAVVPQAWPSHAPADDKAEPVRLIWSNRFMRNTEPEKLLDWVAEKDPDIVVLAEVTPGKRETVIGGLRKTLPHIVERYDMIIASRWPLSRMRAPDDRFALVSVSVKTPAGPIRLAATHLTRPWPFQPPDYQPRHFDKLDRNLGNTQERLVLVGDFNTTPSAALISNFAKDQSLKPAPGLLGTWPSSLPAFARVSIDNVLATPDLNLSNRQTGPGLGSDHNPVYVEIRPARAK